MVRTQARRAAAQPLPDVRKNERGVMVHDHRVVAREHRWIGIPATPRRWAGHRDEGDI